MEMKIRLKGAPSEGAPPDTLKQLVGVSISYDPSIQVLEELQRALRGKPYQEMFIVRTNAVIEGLRNHGENVAADFFCHIGTESPYLLFPKNICELIES